MAVQSQTTINKSLLILLPLSRLNKQNVCQREESPGQDFYHDCPGDAVLLLLVVPARIPMPPPLGQWRGTDTMGDDRRANDETADVPYWGV
jgi:hypothetical protein